VEGQDWERHVNSLSVEKRFRAQEEIHREVAGLTGEEIHGLLMAALQDGEGLPGPLGEEERLAAVRRNELRRIWNLMGRTGWDLYSPEGDPQVYRWREALQGRQEQRRERESRRVGATGSAAGADSVHGGPGQQEALARLEAFVRGTVLPRTRPNTMERRLVLEALGEVSGLCTAQRVELSTGDVIVCTREAGHYDPDDRPTWKDGNPAGWHHCNAQIWDDSSAASRPHTTAR